MNRASRYLAKTNVTVLRFFHVALITLWICICDHATLTDGKVFERCELAQVLRYGHGVDVNDVANWVCIAQHSSSLNTSAFGGNAKSGSHGLFQISDEYWCSPPNKGVACGVTCDRLRDDDISDDFACVKKIHDEHQKLSGDGYNAWVAYQLYCKDNPYEYIEDCFGKEEQEYLHSKSITANSVDTEEDEIYDPHSSGKVYGRCELAKELFLKHKIPMEEISTWVCIAQHESNYDTAVVGRLNADGSGDHGLFQISDLFWCSQKGGKRKACGLPCSKFLDSDITDDVKCVKQIHKEHTRISGDGFNAWSVYKPYCKSSTSKYVRGCFDGIDFEDSKSSEENEKKPLEQYRASVKPTKGDKAKPHGKVYEPCELAEDLRNKYHMPEDQIATWVCIAKHESGYNTSAIGYGDHGLFQISDIYWCSPPGKGWACGLSCADLEDSDISDDVKCIKKIYDEHSHLSGDGFNAWTVYPRHCSNGRAEKYISHCPGSSERLQAASSKHIYSKPFSSNSLEEYQPAKGKIYGRCELANELLNKYHMPMDEIATWVCIANHESSFDTSAVGRLNADGSADHGLFQISDLYWCSDEDEYGKACGLPCSKLLDSDISDDIKCVKQIHEEHTRISGDGFTAWTVYNAYCKERTEQYTRGCFDGSASVEEFEPAQRTTERGFLPKNKPKGKVYEDCELATELRDKHHIPKEQVSSWVCIAKHQSGLNTAASVAGSHGMFFISDEFWCSPPGKGKACDLHCSDLEDSDISDDVECVRKIYDEHQRLFGSGFNAWTVYDQHCSNGRANEYTNHCTGFKTSVTNVIPYGTQQSQYKFSGKSVDTRKPIPDHPLSGNPFLKFHAPLNPNVALQKYSEAVGESVSASEDDSKVVSDYSSNPFLKNVKPKTTVQPIKTTTPSPSWSFSSSPAPTFSNPFLKSVQQKTTAVEASNPFLKHFSTVQQKPTAAPSKAFAWSVPSSANSLQSYQPMNEEKAKNEAFKTFVTPPTPAFTVTPRANRLQPYNLNTVKTFASSPAPLWLTPTTTKPTNSFQLGQWSTKKSGTEANIPFWQTSTTKKPASIKSSTTASWKSTTTQRPSTTTKKPSSTTKKPPITTPSWISYTTKKPSSTTSNTTPSWRTSTTQKLPSWSQFGQWSTQKQNNTAPSTTPSWLTSTSKKPATSTSTKIPLWLPATTQKPSSTTSVPFWVTSTTKKPSPKASSKTPSWVASTTYKPPSTTSIPFWLTSTTQKPTTRPLTSTTPFWLASTTKSPTTTTTNRWQQYQSGKSSSFQATTSTTKSSVGAKVIPLASPAAATVNLKASSTKSPSQPKDSGKYNSGQYSSGKSESKSAKLTLNAPQQVTAYKNVVPSTSTTKTPTTRRLSNWETTTTKPPTTKTTWNSNKVSATPSSSTKFDPFHPFPATTLRPVSTTVVSRKIESPKPVKSGAYVPYKPPTTVKNTEQYVSSKFVSTTVQPSKTTFGSGIKPTTTASPKSEFDTFKPFQSSSGSFNSQNSTSQQSSRLSVKPVDTGAWRSGSPSSTSPKAISTPTKSGFSTSGYSNVASKNWATNSTTKTSAKTTPKVKSSYQTTTTTVKPATTKWPNYTGSTAKSNANSTVTKSTIKPPSTWWSAPTSKTTTWTSSKLFTSSTIKPSTAKTTVYKSPSWKAVSTSTTTRPFLIPTTTQKSTTAQKVTNKWSGSAEKSTTTTKIPTTTVINPTRSQHSSETTSLPSSKDSPYDFYFKLYGIKPPSG